jgi:hypothetical protein
MPEIRDAGRWADFLLKSFADADRYDKEGEGAVKPILAAPEDSQPAHRFLRSIVRGRVEGSRRRCQHLGVRPMVLARNSAFWLMACQEELIEVLRTSAQDTRCDWCGKDRPDRTPTTTFRMPELSVVAQFCRSDQLRLE